MLLFKKDPNFESGDGSLTTKSLAHTDKKPTTTAKKKKHTSSKKKNPNSSEKKRIAKRLTEGDDKLHPVSTMLRAKSTVLSPVETHRKRLDSVFAKDPLERKRQKLASDPDSKLGLSSSITKGVLKAASGSIPKPDVTTARYTKYATSSSTTAKTSTSRTSSSSRNGPSVAELMKQGRQFVRAKTALRPLVPSNPLHGYATIMTPESKKKSTTLLTGRNALLERTMPPPSSAKKQSKADPAGSSSSSSSLPMMRELEEIRTMISDFKTQFSSESIASAMVAHQQQHHQEMIATTSAADRQLIETLQNEKLRLMGEKGELEVLVGTLRSRQGALEMEVEQYKGAAVSRQAEVERITAEKAAALARIGSAAQQAEAAEALCKVQESEIARLRSAIEAQDGVIAQMKAKLDECEMVRRRLHNEVQELRGNIRVFCRVRPPLSAAERAERVQLFAYSATDPGVIEVSEPTKSVRGEQQVRKYEFAYDRVFGPDTTQEQVFEELSQLVQSALDGYSCCVFAYGQTGSGKTYTMEGPDAEPGNAPSPDGMKERGVIPRAVEQIFAAVDRLKECGWLYTIEVSFLEVYNEQLRDLLLSDSSLTTLNSNSNNNLINNNNLNQLKIVNGDDGVNVQGCKVVRVDAPDKVYSLLEIAHKSRAVAKTKFNEHSSRSHSVFRLHIRGHNAKRGETVSSTLNLVDLAGSERLGGATDAASSKAERQKETQNINKSLMNLRKVITALAGNSKHIPYRDSVLTQLLQNSLGGHAKMLMFVNVSPALSSVGQTLNSLRFASTANKCHIGTVQRQVTSDK